MRRFLGNLATWGLLVGLLVAGGGFAWATRHPDAAILVAAEAWPGVGPWVGRFRARYTVPPAKAGQPSGGGVEVVVVPQWVPVHADPTRTPAPAVLGHVWVAAGEPVREAPEEGAPERARVDRYRYLPVLARRGAWVEVALPDGRGWVQPLVTASGEPPLGRATVPPRPLPGRTADPAELAAAVELLAHVGPPGRLGPYPLYTDAARSQLFALDRAAAEVEPLYRARYGRTPVGAPREAVVLFTREAAYRRFQSRDEQLAGLSAAGHTGAGVVAVLVGGQRPAEVAATLVHELAHLLNRRALGPALPPWLDEGIADDLAGSEIGLDGEIRPHRIGGTVVASPGRIELHGAVAALRHVDRAFASGSAVPLDRLAAMEWEEFVRGERSQLHYAQAGFFVRYLLEGGDPALAAGFRRFLDAVAAGRPATGEALAAELARPWRSLEAGMAEWVAEEVKATRPAPPSPPAAR